MGKVFELPGDVSIPALRRPRPGHRDLMRPGPGTPWEDRGRQGAIPAFFRTCRMSLVAPAKLWGSVRRPETAADAAGFAFACAAAWSASFLLHAGLIVLVWVLRYPAPDAGRYLAGWALAGLLPPAGVGLLLGAGAPLYHRLVAEELRGRAPAVLTLNVFAYALGPAALALVPFAGPPAAAGWTVVLLVLGGVRRQDLRLREALTATILVIVLLGALVAAMYAAGRLVWQQLLAG